MSGQYWYAKVNINHGVSLLPDVPDGAEPIATHGLSVRWYSKYRLTCIHVERPEESQGGREIADLVGPGVG